MRRMTTFLSVLFLGFASTTFAICDKDGGCFRDPFLNRDITGEIPEIEMTEQYGFSKIADVAQYKGGDWSQVIGIAKAVSLADALRIAEKNSDITFFFYTKGGQMVLEKEDGSYRVFRHGDAVFFGGKPWWGSAPGLSDGYIRS